ncbi:MAG: hypothetical protein IJR26_07080 [Bacteroidales bacterium]|nr:hypothetical protein [Bacteroidales bacterium]
MERLVPFLFGNYAQNLQIHHTMKKHRLLMLMLASAAVLFTGCGKESLSESGTAPSGGGMAWPERRISSITTNDSVTPRSMKCHFSWNNNKISEIAYTDIYDTLSYSFTYKDDRVVNTHISGRKGGVDFEYLYSNGKINKAIIHIPLDPEDWYLQGLDEEHLPYVTVEYDNEGNVSKINTYYWYNTHNEDAEDALVLRNVGEKIYSYSNGNVTNASFFDYSDAVFTYDNHPNPLSFPVGVIESLSYPLHFDKLCIGYSKYIFDIKGYNCFFGNLLVNKNNITMMGGKHHETRTFSYDYDASGMYPTTMYIVVDDNKYPLFYYTYEN